MCACTASSKKGNDAAKGRLFSRNAAKSPDWYAAHSPAKPATCPEMSTRTWKAATKADAPILPNP